MQKGQDLETPPAPSPEIAPVTAAAPKRERPAATKPKATPRTALKHFGGYLDDDVMEKIALLRVRLKLDNSELIKTAIEELYRKHTAKRAFGDK
jgi:hypothetical protein